MHGHARSLVDGGGGGGGGGGGKAQPPAAAAAVGTDAMDEATPAPSNSKQWKAARRAEYVREKAKFWTNQVTNPEWMLDAPEGLNGKGSTVGAGWYVRARPEGKRCLVVASRGTTVSRQLAGGVLHKWESPLPHGSRETNSRQGRGKSEDGYSILDCIYDDHKKTYWVLDAMVWKGYSLYDCTAEFRLYWLRTKLEEEAPFAAEAAPYKIRLAPYHECDPTGLQAAYAAPVPFIRDGLLFYLKGGHYQLGNTPLVLVWKDRHSSRYLVYSEEQTVVLGVHDPVAHAAAEAAASAAECGGGLGGAAEEGGMEYEATDAAVAGGGLGAGAAVPEGGALLLVTGEGAEVGQVPLALAQEQKLGHGELLRFVIDGAAEDAASGAPVLFNPRFGELGRGQRHRALSPTPISPRPTAHHLAFPIYPTKQTSVVRPAVDWPTTGPRFCFSAVHAPTPRSSQASGRSRRTQGAGWGQPPVARRCSRQRARDRLSNRSRALVLARGSP